MNLRDRPRTGLWIVWAGLLLGIYFKRLWELVGVGPGAWAELGVAIGRSLGPVALIGTGLAGIWAVAPRLVRRLASGRRDHKTVLLVVAIIGLAAAAWTALVSLIPLHLTGTAFGIPWFGEAAARAARAGGAALAVLLAAQIVGGTVSQVLRWQFEDWIEDFLYRTAIGLGVLAYAFLGLAGLALYRAEVLRALVAMLLVCGAVHMWRRGPRLLFSARQSFFANEGRRDNARTDDGLWKAIALIAVLVALIGALAPEVEYDALWYHLGLPALWLDHGALLDLPAEYVALYPMTWELLFGTAMALGGPVAAKLLHYACFLLTALLVHQTTRRFVACASPWLAVALFVSVPTVLWEATSAYNDLALTLHVGLVIYALLRYTESLSGQWMVLAGLNLGLALATKHVAAFALLLVTLGLVVYLWRRHGDLRRALGPAALLAGLGLCLALPWYLRSWTVSGNPFFPELFGVFGAPPDRWDAISDQGLRRFESHFGRPRTLFTLLTLPWDMTVHAARYGGTLGPMFLLLLPGLVFGGRVSRSLPWLGSFVALYIALWASPPSSFQVRFLMPITPLLAVLAAAAYARLLSPLQSLLSNVVGRAALSGGVAVLMLLNFPPTIRLHEVDRGQWQGWLTHVVRRIPVSVVVGRRSEEQYLLQAVPSYAVWRHINAHLAAHARILTFGGGDNLYSRRNRLWSDATIARPAVWDAPAGAEHQALRALHRLGITHVLFDKAQLASLPRGSLAIAGPRAVNDWYTLEYEDRLFVLYRLRWEQIRF